MNEPYNWFKRSESRAPTDLEAFNTGFLERGKAIHHTCVILDQDCRYDPKTGAGDCRLCNFALAHIMESPGRWKEERRK